MKKKKISAHRTVDAYLSTLPPAVKRPLAIVRRTIGRALPGAEEAISYGIPTFKRNGRAVIYFAGWKEHYALYPTTARLTAAFRKELAPYEMSGKGTVRFPLTGAVPVKLIAALAKFRDEETLAMAAARKAKKRVTPRE
jgi:uncharacterized protein YdhG (YjbR/CyaY superfamily)